MKEIIQRFQQMLERNPQNELARFSLGKALFDDGQYAPAKEQFEAALLQKPDWMVVQILVGKCELALGKRDLARQAFAKGLELATQQNHDGPREEMESLLAELAQR